MRNVTHADVDVDNFKRRCTSYTFDVGYRVLIDLILYRFSINNSASLSNKFEGFHFIFKFDISGLLHQVVTTITDRIRDNGTSQSKQNSQSSSMTFIYKTLIIPSFLDSCFISSTVSEDKRTMKIQAGVQVSKTMRTSKTSSALEALWKTLFVFCLYMIGTLPVPSCFVIYDLEPLSLSFDFVFMSEIFKSLSFRLDRLCHLTI
ncbi:hypothetical protein Tco_1426869, partial [Tanacetum coccineum]